MTPKIPSSLKWLIDKRARLDAEIRKTEISVKKAQAIIEQLSDLKQKLAAIDEALAMHEVQVDIELIQPVRSHYVRINLQYGDLTKSILMCLRLNGVGVPVRTSDIVEFIAARHADLEIEPQKRSKLGYIVKTRLKCLYREGLLHRHHLPQTNQGGVWSLKPIEEMLPNVLES